MSYGRGLESGRFYDHNAGSASNYDEEHPSAGQSAAAEKLEKNTIYKPGDRVQVINHGVVEVIEDRGSLVRVKSNNFVFSSKQGPSKFGLIGKEVITGLAE
ncbi:MAG: hypothetical protein HN846_04245 [Candidatus Pacebacteria bacterium]|jgi:hypothetical protein|nr:hypothetical protein [Candidatus Paceibacterota bacterium]MBT3511916.1 hypothetical protein [Candidatus Paceibacterota bacterium]MBT4005238.1 hypothetical protein [Candidatus Paceibacterota bacterium]MBT4358958.1 hypothetical protein [Candidatus Paceibacterota bacterium]MBT4680477.1 hypothetical protein [Candidatus Paceibacterota bacterium]